ncbi:MAG: type II secretion system F family protein, partial [Candidatus Aenigmarchaeota archaeon]|nr:type II secretion system F family protein [Candidatus Aenigmarchaeota archaeon]
YTSKNNYGILTHEIKNLIAQISWGIPFEKSISNFAIKLKSKTISRAIQTIIEAHRSGGNLADVIEAVGQSTVELEKIKRERTSRISSQMMQGYIIYFVFLGVMVGIQKVLIPSLSMSSGAATGSMLGGAITGSDTDITNALMGGSNTAVIDVAAYGVMFSHLAVIQGFFSGIAIGKLAEGSLDAGLKHAVLLAILGYTVMVLFGTI